MAISDTLVNLLLVGAGSGIGGMTRYSVGKVINTSSTGGFPWSTLAVNLIGCLIIGVIYGLIGRGINIDTSLKLFLTVGFCGGFTTFSTFAHENYLLFSGEHFFSFIVYAATTFIFGLVLVYLGYLFVRQF